MTASISRRDLLRSSGALVVYLSLPGCSREPAIAAGGTASLGDRIRIAASGSVTLSLGKVELGQGIGTAIAQVAAEELGIDIGRIDLAPVDTAGSPDEAYTYSSISVQKSVPPVRRAAAAGRHYLLQLAAAELDVSADQLSVDDGEILIRGAPAELSYWQLLAGQQFEVVPDESAPVRPFEDYSIIGTSAQRLDLPGKVFGAASFVQDLRLPDMVHARVLRPPAERATLAEFDASAALGLPGVLKVVRDGNFVGVIAERERQAQNAVIALRKATNWTLARDLPTSKGIYEWLQAAPARIEQVASRSDSTPTGVTTRTIRTVYQRPYQSHGSISPSAAVARFADGQLTVWSHGQGMYPLRDAIASALNLDPLHVRCIHREASGCYGHNGADDAACDAAALAMQFPGRPVRLQWERADEFLWEPHGSAMHIEARADIDESGHIHRWDYDLWSCPHASRPAGAKNAGHLLYAQHRSQPLPIPAPRSIPQPNGGSDRNAVPLYSFQNLNVVKHLVTEIPLRVSSLRGLGAYGNVFAIESFMDELAFAANEDPLQFRIAHLQDQRAIDLLNRLAEVSNWRDRPAPGTGTGWGLGFAQFKNLSAYLGVVFQLVADRDSGDISLKRATAVCDAGLVINPDGVRAQIEGGIVQSASWTLKEQINFDDSTVASGDWDSYPILRFDEVPEVEVILMPTDDQPSLGVGEAAQGPAAAAIANAVSHGSGLRVRQLPLTPERIRATARG